MELPTGGVRVTTVDVTGDGVPDPVRTFDDDGDGQADRYELEPVAA